MPKGKKYDAAEKHFLKIIQQKDKEIKNLKQSLFLINSQILNHIKEKDELNKLVKEQELIINELCKNSNLSKEEASELVERARTINNFLKLGEIGINGGSY